MEPTLEGRLAERVRPSSMAVMHQRWEHLLFLHWEWDPAEIQKTLPPGLTVDVHEGKAWIGIVPFFMSRIRPAFLPPVPWLSWFLELNVRTYAHDERGRPGVWFYSLDCNRPPPVWIARKFFHLPYEHAAMSAEVRGEAITYRSQRRGDSIAADFAWRPSAAPQPAAPGTLDFFLAERYRLFSVAPAGRIRSGCVHHTPYPLSPAEVTRFNPRGLELNHFSLPGRPPDHAVCSRMVDVEIFGLE